MEMERGESMRKTAMQRAEEDRQRER